MEHLDSGEALRHLTPAREAHPQRQAPQGTRYALVVGIDRYNDPPPPLHYAVNDAKAIAHKLEKDFGFQVRFLQDEAASKSAIRDGLERLAREAKPQDIVVVFFAGHGQNHPDPHRQKEGYLVPADATTDPNSWLAEAEIIQHARTMPARRIFLFFDACYSGSTLEQEVPVAGPEGQILMALVAGTSRQPVLDGGAGDHSIFTRAILDGLDGWADVGQRPDDVISAAELIAYVTSEVMWRSKALGRDQKPVGGPLQRSGEGADIRLLPVRARLKAPLLRNSYSPNPEDRVAAAEQLAQRTSTDTGGVVQKKAAELIRLAAEDEVLRVRVAAVRGLGQLGHPDGWGTLNTLVQSETEEPELRGAAASALGELAVRVVDPEARERAIGTLVEALDPDEDERVLEQVKAGLSRIPESADRLVAALEKPKPGQKRQILDALACLGANPDYLDSAQAWPPLRGLDSRVPRRWYLARRQLRPWWATIRRQAITLAAYGAVGLSLAYLVVLVVARASHFQTQGPAVLTYNLLPGALGGIGLAFMPRFLRALSRRPGSAATILGGTIGGLCLGLGMAAPNWFLGLGRDGPYPVWLYIRPGLVLGPLLGLALVAVSRMRPSMHEGAAPSGLSAMIRESLVPPVIVALVGALGFAVGRIPPAVSFGLQPHALEVLLWALGGAILGAALATGWSLSSADVGEAT